MSHDLSDVAGFWVDSATGVLTDISGDINNLSINGGNALIDDTGLGDSNRTEQRDLGAVKRMSITFMMNSTTDAIFAPLVAAGTAVAKTVQAKLRTGSYISGESNVGAVSLSVPVGMQTGTAEFSSLSGSGFDHTSVAL